MNLAWRACSSDFADADRADGRFANMATQHLTAPLQAWVSEYVRARRHAEVGLVAGARPA